MVAITGQAPASVLGTDAFQDVDITSITAPVTKHNYLVNDAWELPGLCGRRSTSRALGDQDRFL